MGDILENAHALLLTPTPTLTLSRFTLHFLSITISSILGEWASLDSRGLSENLGSSRNNLFILHVDEYGRFMMGTERHQTDNSISDLFPAAETAQRTSAPTPMLGLLPMEHLRFCSMLFTLPALIL